MGMTNTQAVLSTADHTHLVAQETKVPEESATSRWCALLFGLMMFFTPAFGVPNEEMLQDTLKSAIVSMIAIIAWLIVLRPRQTAFHQLLWHRAVWLPLGLAAYAFASTFLSHTYLGGVETVRWLILSLIFWIGLNIETPHWESRVLWGIHWGISIASCWTALQFWFDFRLFPQGAAPASTFVNRNFFAEYAVCAFPYSIYLLLRCKDFNRTLWIAAMIGFNFVALMMAGTRSATIAFGIFAMGSVILILWRREIFKSVAWNRQQSILLFLVLLLTVFGLGRLPASNPTKYGENAIQHTAQRAASVTKAEEYTEGSFSVRTSIWASTVRMIRTHPLWGVGAGAWEVFVPLYQTAGTPTETDYYAHNDVLQILAEYGLVGWSFWIALLTYLAYSARCMWRNQTRHDQEVALLRYAALSSITILLLVCNAEFPLRMASTGAIFALSLAILAACDSRSHSRLVSDFSMSSSQKKVGIMIGGIGLALGILIIFTAIECEKNIVRGVKLALAISRSGTAANPYWDEPKIQMRSYLQNGIALNGHYRKLTAIAADEMARMGDWKDALWVWESIHQSRPYILAIVINIARAHLELGNVDNAKVFLNKAMQLQPSAPVVKLLQGQILAKTGHLDQARQNIQEVLTVQPKDHDTVRMALQVAEQSNDLALWAETLELQRQSWPMESIDGFLKLGSVYALDPQFHNEAKALEAYRNALRTTPNQYKEITLAKIPHRFHSEL